MVDIPFRTVKNSVLISRGQAKRTGRRFSGSAQLLRLTSNRLGYIGFFCRLRDVVGGAIGERLDGAGGLVTSGAHQTAAIHEEEVGDIVSTVILVHHRMARIVPDAA